MEKQLELLDLDLDFDFNEEETGAEPGVNEVEALTENNDIESEQIELNTDESAMPDLTSFLDNSKAEADKPKEGKAGKTTVAAKAPSVAKVIKGPRIIKAFGEEMWVEEDDAVTNEEIRLRLVNEHNLGEFEDASQVIFDWHKKSKILDVRKSFKKKG